MKKHFILLLLLVTTIGISQARNKNKLKIELSSGFNNDLVKIYADDKLVYNQRFTTFKKFPVPKDKLNSDKCFIRKPKKPVKLIVEINGKKYEKMIREYTKEMEAKNYFIMVDYDREKGTADIREMAELRNDREG